MKRILLKTGDGSFTFQLPEWDEQYHSKNGAIAEALHVFIKEGLHHWISKTPSSEISIMEIGFGTGLNCFLTVIESMKMDLKIRYTGVEAYPLEFSEIEKLNYPSLLNCPDQLFLQLHSAVWERGVAISDTFQLEKQKRFFSEIERKNSFHLIYFDAFGIKVQPELWTAEIFQLMYEALKPRGVLTTYAANGSARRAMQSVGFTVERLPGPPGKKEMMRATKE